MKGRTAAGYTMVEVLIATGVFTFVIAAVLGAFSLGMRSMNRYSGHTDTITTSQNVLAHLEKDAISACGVTTVAGYPASPSAVALIEPTFDASGSLVASTDVVVYYCRGNQLLRDVIRGAGGSRQPITGQLVVSNATGSPLFDYLKDQGGTLVPVGAVTAAEVIRIRLQASGSVVANGAPLLSHVDFRMRNKH